MYLGIPWSLPLDLGPDRPASDSLSCAGVLPSINSQSNRIDFNHRFEGPSDPVQIQPDLLRKLAEVWLLVLVYVISV